MITAYAETIFIKMRLSWWANTFECISIVYKSFKAVLASKSHIIIMMVIRTLEASLLCSVPIVRPGASHTNRIFTKIWLLWWTNTLSHELIKYRSIRASYTFSIIGIPMASFLARNTGIVVKQIWHCLRACTTSQLIIILKIVWTRSTFISLTVPEIRSCTGSAFSFLVKVRKFFRAST